MGCLGDDCTNLGVEWLLQGPGNIEGYSLELSQKPVVSSGKILIPSSAIFPISEAAHTRPSPLCRAGMISLQIANYDFQSKEYAEKRFGRSTSNLILRAGFAWPKLSSA